MIAAGLAFLAAALGAAGIGTLLAPVLPAMRGRSSSLAARAPRGARLVGFLATAGSRAGLALTARAPGGLHARIEAAALAGPLAGLGPRDLMAAKFAAAGCGVAAGTLLGAAAPGRLGIASAVAAPVAGFLAPDLWLRRRAEHRARAVRRELPALLDLLRVTVEAGLPLAAALAAVGGRARGTLGAEWGRVGREVSLGRPLAAAIDAMTARLPIPEITALVGALERSTRHGAPLAETLAAQSRDARAARRRRIQEEAARAGPKIQLVVALLLVPSVLLVIAAALAAAILDGRAGLALG